MHRCSLYSLMSFVMRKYPWNNHSMWDREHPGFGESLTLSPVSPSIPILDLGVLSPHTSIACSWTSNKCVRIAHSFCVWFLSLNRMSLTFIHNVVVCIRNSLFALSSIPLYSYTQIIHSPVNVTFFFFEVWSNHEQGFNNHSYTSCVCAYVFPSLR